MRRAWLWMPCLLLASTPEAAYVSARGKLNAIESGKAPPGARYHFSPLEANAFAREEARIKVGGGMIRNPRIELGHNRATGSARIDFARLQTARGAPPGRLLSWILRGEREVSVTVRIESGKGKARVDVEKAEVSGVPLSGRALNLLIEYYLEPRCPEVVIGRPFDLRHRVESIAVSAQGVLVRIGG